MERVLGVIQMRVVPDEIDQVGLARVVNHFVDQPVPSGQGGISRIRVRGGSPACATRALLFASAVTLQEKHRRRCSESSKIPVFSWRRHGGAASASVAAKAGGAAARTALQETRVINLQLRRKRTVPPGFRSKGDSVNGGLTSSCLRTAWKLRPASFSGRRCWPGPAFAMTSSVLILGNCRPCD